jgi:GNAT superfamily N-acetyltransferase
VAWLGREWLSQPVTVRLARVEELAGLREIEKEAGELFREIGMTAVFEHPPPPLHVFEDYQRNGRAVVTVDREDQPVGFVLVKLIDGAAHVEQVSVHPSHARRRLGQGLIDYVDGWAVERGLPALTLTTFRSVAWNAPYYARLGFRELSDLELTPGLREVVAAETAIGLDPDERVCMYRETGGVTG